HNPVRNSINNAIKKIILGDRVIALDINSILKDDYSILSYIFEEDEITYLMNFLYRWKDHISCDISTIQKKFIYDAFNSMEVKFTSFIKNTFDSKMNDPEYCFYTLTN